jgi:alpha-L-rhamnosidase
MEERQQRIPLVRRIAGGGDDQVGIGAGLTGMLAGKGSFNVPAHTMLTVLFDQSYNTVAYPELTVSGGKNATIRLSYAESLVDKNGRKGDRGVIEGKELRGNYDVFVADGYKDR